MESQAPLNDLLESITTAITTAVHKASKLGANITSCISGQEEEARSVIKQTGKTNSMLGVRVAISAVCCDPEQPSHASINCKEQ
jgi:hypothetical protein